MKRSHPPLLRYSALTESVFIITGYAVDAQGRILASEKYDVTDDFIQLVGQYLKTHTITPVGETENAS